MVDLKVFRHRGFTASVLTISLAFAAFFGVNVLTPLWLQNFMGYTATQAGLATAWTGGDGIHRRARGRSGGEQARPTQTGLCRCHLDGGWVTFWRTIATTDMGFWDISIPLVVMGLCLALLFYSNPLVWR